jgi:hypothetical protein
MGWQSVLASRFTCDHGIVPVGFATDRAISSYASISHRAFRRLTQWNKGASRGARDG